MRFSVPQSTALRPNGTLPQLILVCRACRYRAVMRPVMRRLCVGQIRRIRASAARPG